MRRIMPRMLGCVLCSALLISGASTGEAAKKSTGKGKAKQSKAAEKKEKKEAAAEASKGNALHTFQRAITFDPHPTLVEPLLSPIDAAGKKVSYTVEFDEVWDSESANPSLKELGFKVVMTQNGAASRLNIAKKPIDAKKIKKGALLGEAKFGEFAVAFTVAELQKNGKQISGLTIEGNLLGLEGVAGQPGADATAGSGEPVPVPVPVVEPVVPEAGSQTGVSLAQALLKKAADLGEAQSVSKLALYKKALLVLGDAPVGDAAALAVDLKAKIVALGGVATGNATPSAIVTGAPGLPAGNAVAAAKINPEAKAFFDDAKKQFSLGNEAEARTLLRQAVDKDPGFLDAWLLTGKNALENSKYAQAKTAFEKAIGIRDDESGAAVGFFKACYYQGETEIGLEKLESMAKRYPTKLAIRTALAECYFQAGNYSGCEEECVKILNEFKNADSVKDLLAKAKEKTK
ncbi:MAG: tetratricopeptide repeat protein [Candidatus Ozemobacteraceae bacterium]